MRSCVVAFLGFDILNPLTPLTGRLLRAVVHATHAAHHEDHHQRAGQHQRDQQQSAEWYAEGDETNDHDSKRNQISS